MSEAMVRSGVFCGLLFCFVALAASAAAEDPSSSVIENQQQALDRALEYAGFSKSKYFTRPSAASCVAETAFEDSTTPFLADSITGPRRWIVTFDSVFLDYDKWTPDAVETQLKKTYHFVIDPPTGRLLKVYTVYNGDDMDSPPELPADSAAARLDLNEHYVSLVDSVPPVSFYEALNASVACHPLKAKEIQAWLVMLSKHGAEARPCWVILARGTVPFPLPPAPSLSPEADEMRLSGTTVRCVVDATTGKWLSFEG